MDIGLEVSVFVGNGGGLECKRMEGMMSDLVPEECPDSCFKVPFEMDESERRSNCNPSQLPF